MLKAFAEWIEAQYPVLVIRPWLATVAILVIGAILVAGWLMTAWRLGKWYHGREIAALRAENVWLTTKERAYIKRIERLLGQGHERRR